MGGNMYRSSGALASSVREQLVAQIAVATAVAALAIVTGAAVALRPSAAMLLAGVAVLVPVLSAISTLRIELVYCCLLLVASAFVGLPRHIQVGPTTLTSLETIVAAAAALAYFVCAARRPFLVPKTLVAYVSYGVVSLMIARPSSAGVETVLVAVVFVACISLSQRAVLLNRTAAETIVRYFTIAAVLELSLFALALLSGKAGIHNQNPNAAFSAREFAIFAVLILAWGLSRFRFGRRGRLLAVAAIALIVVSLSRSDIAAAAVMCSITWLEPDRLATWVKTCALIAVTLGGFYFAISDYQPLHDRFYTGDVHQVAGISLNTEGRSQAWRIVWDRYLTSPIFGHGPGDADNTIAANDRLAHPHNDYLRILDDGGIIGLVLWTCGYLSLIRKTGRTRRPDDLIAAQASRCALLALVGIAVVMIFDNPVIYLQIMAPLGVLVGVALALNRQPTGQDLTPDPAEAAA